MSISRKDNSLNGARNLGNLGDSKQINGFVGRKDKIDFAKFTLSETRDFGITLQRFSNRASPKVTLRDSRGAILTRFRGGTKPATFNSRLAAGVYYLGVQRRKGEVKYKIQINTSLVTTAPGVVPNSTRDIGLLSGTYTNADAVGATDTDLYKFTLNDVSNLQARVNSSTANTRLELIRDANSNGLIDANEIIVSKTNYSKPYASNITEDLPAGTYYVRVLSAGTTSTTYQLDLVATPFGGNIAPEPGNTLPVARDLGALSSTFSARDYVGKLDATDFYRFTLNDISNLQATFKGSSTNAKIQLIRDSNNNGLVDNGEVLASDTNYSSTFLSSVTQDLPAGSYFIQVEPSTGESTSYALNLVATPFGGNISPDPGNTLSTARNVGAIGTFSAREYVGLVDSDDFYRFTLSSAANLQARVTGSSNNTRIRLIRDTNGNGLVDNGEILASDTNYSSTFLSDITEDLSAGTYFVQVIPINTSISTNYSLSLIVG